jgi:hypothetical protein
MLQPPTDNLYKFMAISGLLLFAAFFVLPYLKIIELEDGATKLQGDMRKVEVEQQFLQDDADAIEQIQAALTSEAERHNEKVKSVTNMKDGKEKRKLQQKVKDEAEKLVKRADELEKVKEKKRETLKQISLLTQDLRTNADLWNNAQRRVRDLSRVMYVAGFIGIVSNTFGFHLWYKRVQKHLDKVLEKDAFKKEAGSANE